MANPRRVAAKAVRDSIACRELSVYGFSMKAFFLLAKIVPHKLLLDAFRAIEYRAADARKEDNRMEKLTITANEAGQRMDKFLGKYLNLAGKGFLYK